jgi:tRNA(Ile)-lysidine synthase
MDLDPITLFSSLDTGETLVVAVSGGSDSLSLLLLADDFLRRHRPSVRLVAVTVDHRLRPEAADEAAWVAGFCARRGIAHDIVAWAGDKPRSGLAAAAREARYELLAAAAQRNGASVVLVGHTLDDQAETLAMRGLRGDGIGLAGMARATLFDSRVWIARPLLGQRRLDLRRWLGQRGVEWIDDPSNDNPAAERVRVRKRLDPAEAPELAGLAQTHGQARSRIAAQAAELVRRFADHPAPGLLRLDRAFLATGEGAREAGIFALRALLATAGGVSRLPDAARSGNLLARLQTGAPLRATLARAVVDARRQGIFIRREARDLPSVSMTGQPLVWDGRMRLSAAPVSTGLTIRALGREATGSPVEEFAVNVPPALVTAAMATQPALFSGEALLGRFLPETTAFPGIAAATVAPFARFLPGFDLPLAAALHQLTGAPALSTPPWPEHNAAGA